jgi:glycosyltransferase involved in cell wall biosynthesis
MSTAAPRACIAAMMKLERPYLLEWVAWYRILGFDIVIADHGGDDGQSELLAKLQALGVIHRIDVRSFHGDVQRRFYRMLFRWARRNKYDYVGFFDGDEYFEPMTIGTAFEGSGLALVDRMFRDSKAAALVFNWMIFGDSHQATGDGELVTSRFQWAAEKPFAANRFVKSFCHVERCHSYFTWQLRTEYALNAHLPTLTRDLLLHDGSMPPDQIASGVTQDVSWERARVRHYVVKTLDEFRRRKINRGGFWTHYNETFFNAHNRNDDFAPLPAHVTARLRREVAELDAATVGTSDVPVPIEPWFTPRQLGLRSDTLPYFKGYCYSVVRRWRRGYEKARARLAGAHKGGG